MIPCRYRSGAWINLVKGGNKWSMRTTANLTVRADSGKVNSSPISAMKPITRMKQGCQYSVQIPGTVNIVLYNPNGIVLYTEFPTPFM